MMKKLKMISGVLFFALMGANVGANFYGSWAEHIAYSQRGWEAKEASAENIARRMIEACDGAAGGRGNEDDMTIVVARVRLK